MKAFCTCMMLLFIPVAAGGRPCLPCSFVPAENGPESFENCLCQGNPATINPEILKKVRFDSTGRAFIFADSGWILINRKGKAVLEGIVSMDNGPDYPESGLMRFIENGKWGYANIEGKKIIPAKYDGALPFENGVAAVCTGCKLRADGEHHSFDGGKQFNIDTLGHKINPQGKK